MLDDTTRAFLEKPLIARMSTIDSNGYPHTVPVWFMRDDDDLLVISVRQTRKIGYIAANAKGAIVVGGEPGDGGGYLFKGEFSVEPDGDQQWTRKFIYRYESGEKAEQDVRDWADLEMVLLRLKVTKVSKV